MLAAGAIPMSPSNKMPGSKSLEMLLEEVSGIAGAGAAWVRSFASVRMRRSSENITLVTQDLFKSLLAVVAFGGRDVRNLGKHCRLAGLGLSWDIESWHKLFKKLCVNKGVACPARMSYENSGSRTRSSVTSLTTDQLPTSYH